MFWNSRSSKLCVSYQATFFFFSQKAVQLPFCFSSNLYVICSDIIVCNVIYQLLAMMKIVQLPAEKHLQNSEFRGFSISGKTVKLWTSSKLQSNRSGSFVHIEFWFLLDVVHKCHLQICAQENFSSASCLGSFHCIHVGLQNWLGIRYWAEGCSITVSGFRMCNVFNCRFSTMFWRSAVFFTLIFALSYFVRISYCRICLLY
jgi:hypothetical protein